MIEISSISGEQVSLASWCIYVLYYAMMVHTQTWQISGVVVVVMVVVVVDIIRI